MNGRDSTRASTSFPSQETFAGAGVRAGRREPTRDWISRSLHSPGRTTRSERSDRREEAVRRARSEHPSPGAVRCPRASPWSGPSPISSTARSRGRRFPRCRRRAAAAPAKPGACAGRRAAPTAAPAPAPAAAAAARTGCSCCGGRHLPHQEGRHPVGHLGHLLPQPLAVSKARQGQLHPEPGPDFCRHADHYSRELRSFFSSWPFPFSPRDADRGRSGERPKRS